MEIGFNTFTPRSTQRIPKLMLEANETARVCFLDPRPRQVFVHTFETVKTDEFGQPIVVHGKWPDGQPRESIDTDYAGKLRCLGSDDVLMASGTDPENCPACAAHIANPAAVKAPTRRILGQVLKYNTRPGTATPSTPFSATLVVWDLTEKRFEQLVSIYNEHGDLKAKDLILGPCENKQMQKFTIQPGGDKAHWISSETNQQFVKSLLEQESFEDIESAAGKLPTNTEMRIKVNEIVRAYNHAFNKDNVASNAASLLESASTPSTSFGAFAAPAKAVAETPQAIAEAEVAKAAAAVPATSLLDESEVAEPERSTPTTHTNSTASLEELLASL